MDHPPDTHCPSTAFLRLLGKDPTKTWFRTLTPKKGANKSRSGKDLHGFDAAALKADNKNGANVYFIPGDANQATGKNKKTGKLTGCVCDEDIYACLVVYVEWDDKPHEWQLSAWKELKLPEPTAMVLTGGKSVHCYWRLREPMQPAAWKQLQAKLIDYAGGDQQCKNPSRLMRLPGFRYISKDTGQPNGNVAELIHQADVTYSADDIERCLPEPPAEPATSNAPSKNFTPRTLKQIEAAAQFIPNRIGGQGTYDEDRNAICGCSAALAEAGVADPDGEALRLLGHKWPSVAAARQVLGSAHTRSASSFWAIARENGFNLKRAKAATPRDAHHKPPRKQRKLGHSKAMACFERCVKIQSKRERNSIRRRARLLMIAKQLGLAACINRQEIAQQVLEAKDEQQGHSFKALTAQDRLAMEAPKVCWLIPGLVPANDLTIIGGRPKVGKTRLAVAMVAAVLNGESFTGFDCIQESKPVLLITDDQADGDTHQMLQQLKIWDHPQLVWSRHFRLKDNDIDAMLATIKANPGALVVMDSLRSVSRSLPAGENDPEIGAYLYDLKAAVIEAGGSLVVIHHCNKAADLVGTEALSGHNAIAGAANTVITLHYCPDATGRPNKTNPQRRLFSEGRSGAGCDLVIDRTEGGTYWQVMKFAELEQQLQDSKKSEGLNDLQEQLLELIDGDPGPPLTRREAVELLGLEWGDGRGREAKRVGRALNRLVKLDRIEKKQKGREDVFFSHDGQK